MNIRGHLSIEQIVLAPSVEWMDEAPGWRVLRLSQGAAYWLGAGLTRDLAVGDVVVAAAGAVGTVRVSQLGEARLHGFHFSPELFSGFFTLPERHFFEHVAVRTKPPVQILPAAHPVAVQFAALVAQAPSRHGLFERSRVLELLGTLFAEDLKQHRPTLPKNACALKRFKEIVEHLSDQEIMNCSPRQLAEMCGCSVRHFTRLFRESFGVPPRAKQIEFRILKARNLLATTDEKIIHIATDSGFHSLGLFNALFKRHAGMTPSEWRERQTRTVARLSRAAIITLCASLIAQGVATAEPPPGPRAINGPAAVHFVAATPDPDTGESPAERLKRIEREVEIWRAAQGPTNAPTAPTTKAPVSKPPVATSTNGGPVFAVHRYDVQGNTLMPAPAIDAILQKHTGEAMDFTGLRKALQDMQMAYRDRGFVSVSVALPKQQLTNGVVKVQVTEGRLAEINIVNNRWVSTENVRRALPSLRTNTFLNGLVLSQELDRANASRDRQIYPEIAPGPEPGTSTLTLKVKDRVPLHGRIELNNNSTPGTPELRINSAVQYNNLWQHEHQLGLQYSFTPEQFKESPTRYGEAPLVASYSAFYRLPISGGNGVSGAPAPRDLGWSDFGYDEVNKRFRAPSAGDATELLFYGSRSSSDTARQLVTDTLTPVVIPPEGSLQVSDQQFNQTLTINENLGLRLLQPVPPLGQLRSSLSLGLDYKNYRASSTQDRVFQAAVFVPDPGPLGPPFTAFSSPPTASSQKLFSSVSYLPLALAWEGSIQDKHGSTSFNMNHSLNVGLFNDRKDFQAVAGSAKADSMFYTLNAGFTRDQKIVGEWGGRLHADGQYATSPLISNEQFGLGGAAGVRGYRDGEEYGDTGWRALFEVYTPSFNLGMVDGTAPFYVKLSPFVDYGQRYLLDPGTRQGSLSMLGTGLGLSANIGQHIDFRINVGVPLSDTPGRPSGTVRVLFGVGVQF